MIEIKEVVMILTNSFKNDLRVYKEAIYLVENHFRVTILAWDRELEFSKSQITNINGIKIIRVQIKSTYGTGLKQLIPYIRFLIFVKKYIKTHEIHFLHGHDLDGQLTIALFKNNRITNIFDMHEYYIGRVNSRFKKIVIFILTRISQNKADYIIFISELQKKYMTSKNIKKLTQIRNFPDASYVDFNIKHFDGRLNISYIGNVRQDSVFKNLFRACKHEGVDIFVHGGGVKHKELLKFAREYDNAHVTGPFEFNQINDLYLNSHISYIMYESSNFQHMNSYPVKFYESIVSGTPVIVSKFSIMSNFVEKNKIGFIVDGNDIKEISELIQNIDKNRHLLECMHKNLENLAEKYLWDTEKQRLKDIYYDEKY